MVILASGEALARSGSNNLGSKYILWQVNLWDWFAKASPFIISFSAIGFYFLGYKDWTLLINVFIVLGVSISIFWWFWIIYTVASIAIMLNDSGKNLEDVVIQLREIKKIVKEKKDDL